MRPKILNALLHPLSGLKRILYYSFYKSKFKELHFNSRIVTYNTITPFAIRMGKATYIGRNSRVEGVSKYGNNCYSPEIWLKDGAKIQQNCHITCANSIIVGEDTCISAGVTITDINHPYTDITQPIEYQDLEVKYVKIDRDCKIYNGAVILPGVNIGKHCVIGANAVVNRDIPDYCVAVGVPAKIVKRYNHETRKWENTATDGSFLN